MNKMKLKFYYFFSLLFYLTYSLSNNDDSEYVLMTSIDNKQIIVNQLRNINDFSIYEFKKYILLTFNNEKSMNKLAKFLDDNSIMYEIENNESIDMHYSPVPKFLDRLDQIGFSYDNNYNPPNDGSNQNIYILDNGINVNHQEFSNCNLEEFLNNDFGCKNHGTIVASYVCGHTLGAAKNSTVFNVPLTISNNCNNEIIKLSNVLIALDQIYLTIKNNSIINMSWSFPQGSMCLDEMLEDLYVEKGVILVASAGNENANNDFTISSPQRLSFVIKVGAIDDRDRVTDFSNYGLSVLLYAPGEDLIAPWYSSTNGYILASGTSFSSPLTCAIISIILNEEEDVNNQNIDKFLIKYSDKDKIENFFGFFNNNILNLSNSNNLSFSLMHFIYIFINF